MAKSIRSKIKRKFRAVKRQNVFLPTEESRLQRVVDFSNGIEPVIVPKRFSFLVKAPRQRGRQQEELTDEDERNKMDVIEETNEDEKLVDKEVMMVEDKEMTKVEKMAIMMTRNQFKKKSKALAKSKASKRQQPKRDSY